jgi:hypothetical protein
MTYNHCFTLSDGCVYATPFSSTGTDFMSDSVCVCSWNNDEQLLARTARILSAMCNYWGIMMDEIADGRDEQHSLYTYALRAFVTKAERIEKIWGEYATRSIFNTMGWEF